MPHGSPPPTRGRSNALTGFSDPRAPTTKPIEQNLIAELKRPAAMATTLRDFLDEVFRDANIMREKIVGGETRAGLIYAKYSGQDSGSGGHRDPTKTDSQFFLAIWSSGAKHALLKGGYFQYTKVNKKNIELKDAVFDLQGGKTINLGCYYDFLYFPNTSGGKALFRLYLNVRVQSLPNVISKIANYIGNTKDHGVKNFKAACPLAAEGRDDTVVVYCLSETYARALGQHLLKLSASNFLRDVPGMTTRLDPALGVALGAEPEWQATGMDSKPKGYPESAQSFGTIRSELIAMAIENYHANKGVIGTGFDPFARCVCTAFRGYGLDPMNPGN